MRAAATSISLTIDSHRALKQIWKYMVMVEDALTLVTSMVQQNIDNYRVLQKLSISLNREEITAFITHSFGPLFKRM